MIILSISHLNPQERSNGSYRDNLADQMTGKEMANVLDGGIGQDVMAGFGGNDTCVVDDQAGVVAEVAGGGTDPVISPVLLFTLPADRERYGKVLGNVIPRALWREQPRR